MATKANRGTKRRCQNSECGERFYDLGRETITCPVCGAAFVPVIPGPTAAELADERRRNNAQRRPVAPVPVAVPEDVPVAEGDEALAEVAEGEEEAAGPAAGDETFLEEEDEGGDVSGIIGGVTEGEEEA